MTQRHLPFRRTLILSTSLIAALPAGMGRAQDQQNASGGTVTLDSIVLQGAAANAVTNYNAREASSATLTDTPLRDVPQTVNVIGREEIVDTQARTMNDVLEGTPNLVQYGTAANRGETFMLRGFRMRGNMVDGTSLNATADRPEVMQDMAAIERVEVLKGPASVLYGAGNPGGVVNVITRQPEATPGGEVSLSYGSFGFRRAEATATGALNASGTLTGRVTAAAQEEDGWVTGRPGSDQQYLGGVIAWAPTDATRLSFTLEQTRAKRPFDRGLLWVPSLGAVLTPYDSWLSEEWSMIDAEKTRARFNLEHEVSAALTLRASLNLDTSYTHDTGVDHQGLRDDGRSLRRRFTDRVEDTDSQDLRLETLWKFTTGQVEHNVLSGVQYTWSHMDFNSARANIDDIDIFDPVHMGGNPPATTPNSDYDEYVDTRSVYLQDQISFSEQWKGLVGLRWDEYVTHRDERIGTSIPENTHRAVTGRLGLVWQPLHELSLYASYAQSFAPQTGYDRDGDPLDPEEGEQFEVGAKWDIVPDRLSGTLSVFDITKSNVATSPADDPDADYRVLTGEQRSRGVELELAGEITPGWKLHGGVGYIDAEITEDEDLPVGNRLGGIPRVTASLWTTYSFQPGHRAEGLTIGGGLVHVGSRMGDDENSFEVDGYTRFDAMARYAFEGGATLSLAVNNLTDEDYIISTQSDREITAGAPRNVQIRLGWAF